MVVRSLAVRPRRPPLRGPESSPMTSTRLSRPGESGTSPSGRAGSGASSSTTPHLNIQQPHQVWRSLVSVRDVGPELNQ